MRATISAGCLLAALSACRAPETRDAVAPAQDHGSINLDESVDSRWQYLAAKYDADGDGVVARDEYDRHDAAFERLDRDGDGALGEADFASRSSSRAATDGRARRFVGRYFQDDDDDSRLGPDEARSALARYDADDDGRLTEEEFTCGCEQRRVELPGDESRLVQRYMRDHEPWPTMVAGADGDGDGALSSDELVAFVRRDGGELRFRAPGRRPSTRGASSRSEDVPRPGEVAPDFELRTPDGSRTVRLSEFAGERPVALIFGSFT